MDFRIVVLTVALLSLAGGAVVRAQDSDDEAPAAVAPAAAPAPAVKASAASPAVTPQSVAPAAASAPAAPAPASAPAAPAAEPVAAPAASAAPAPAPVAAAAPAPVAAKQVVNAATYTRDIGRLYAEMAKEADEFTAKNQQLIESLKDKEAAIQVKLDAVNKEYDEKSKDPAVQKQTHFFTGNKILKGLKKQAKQLNNDLEGAKKDTKRQTASVIDQMWAMQKNHIAAIKAKYKEVEELVKAAENE